MQQIRHITLPLLKPTVVILTIMGVGGIFHGDELLPVRGWVPAGDRRQRRSQEA